MPDIDESTTEPDTKPHDEITADSVTPEENETEEELKKARDMGHAATLEAEQQETQQAAELQHLLWAQAGMPTASASAYQAAQEAVCLALQKINPETHQKAVAAGEEARSQAQKQLEHSGVQKQQLTANQKKAFVEQAALLGILKTPPAALLKKMADLASTTIAGLSTGVETVKNGFSALFNQFTQGQGNTGPQAATGPKVQVPEAMKAGMGLNRRPPGG